MRQLAATVLAFALTLTTAAAQLPPPPPPPPPPPNQPARDAAAEKTGTAVLKGVVVSAETGKPLRRAQVRAAGGDLRTGRTVSTDENGAWVLSELPAGRYTINVSKGGYVQLAYGQRRPFEQGRPVDLAEGQTLDKLDVSLPKGSVITGRLYDEFGEPVSGARVSAMRNRFVGGVRRLFSFGGPGTSDTTDDIGQFRLHGLSPGDYFISASLGTSFSFERSDDRTGYAPTFYPGTAAVGEAQKVSVALGQETQGISFALAVTRVANVSGTVVSGSGKPVPSGMVMLFNPASVASGPMGKTSLTRADGTFTISNVEPGDYQLHAQVRDLEAIAMGGSTSGIDTTEVGIVPVTVAGKDVTGVTLVTGPTATASGKVTFVGGAPTGLAAASVNLAAVPAAPTMFTMGGGIRLKSDWTFEGGGLSGRRIFRANAPGWHLRSVTLEGNDITDTGADFGPGANVSGIEIELTKDASVVTGTVHGSKNEAITDYIGVIFASDPAKWGFMTRYVRTSRPDQSGKFIVNGLPPGDYLAVALEYLEPGDEQDPDVLERLKSLGTSLSIKEGEKKAVRLKMASGSD